MNKEQKIREFDPNSIGQLQQGMYGLPFTLEECDTVLVPVPWEVTVSYGGGTAEGPAAIREASYQVDLYDPLVPEAWKWGIAMDEISDEVRQKSEALRNAAETYIEKLANGADENDEHLTEVRQKITSECEWMNGFVRDRVLHFISKGKLVGLVGGDHSTPLGMVQALSQKHTSFAILQIDAHADLRNAYEGFKYSHASIMYNALQISAVKKLVQVGIRDYCDEEVQLVKSSGGRIVSFYDRDIKHAQYGGESWSSVCDRICNELPEDVYLSFDIDGLDPKLCPNTGTPVAGGFETEQVLFLLETLVKKGKRIIGFDLNEVSPGDDGSDWDANVAARLLFRIANLAQLSNRKLAQ